MSKYRLEMRTKSALGGRDSEGISEGNCLVLCREVKTVPDMGISRKEGMEKLYLNVNKNTPASLRSLCRSSRRRKDVTQFASSS